MENLIGPVLGLIFVIFGIVQLIRRKALLKSGKVSEGVIIDLVSGSNSTVCPVVRFLTSKQEWITEKSNVGTTSFPFRKGERVTIIYNESNPKEFIIQSWAQNLLPYVFIIVGCISVIAGSYLFLKSS